MTDFLTKHLFTILTSTFTIGGAYAYIRYKVSEIDDVKREVKEMKSTVVELATFQAVQTEKNRNHDERYVEVIDWLKSISSKLDDLVKSKN